VETDSCGSETGFFRPLSRHRDGILTTGEKDVNKLAISLSVEYRNFTRTLVKSPLEIPVRDTSNMPVFYREFLAERDEILRNKWILSEDAGHDVGFDVALIDWRDPPPRRLVGGPPVSNPGLSFSLRGLSGPP